MAHPQPLTSSVGGLFFIYPIADVSEKHLICALKCGHFLFKVWAYETDICNQVLL